MFEDVYATMPANLQSQRDELCGDMAAQQKDAPSILSFEEASQRAAG
jgi:hypothetical protein